MAASDRPNAPVTTDRGRETTGDMERISFRVTEAQLAELKALVDSGQFPNRSEAIRAAIRQLVTAEARGGADGE